jgi:sulfur carrier protein ThiS
MNRPYSYLFAGESTRNPKGLSEGLAMKVRINYDEHEIPAKSRFRRAVKIVRDLKKDDPMIQSLIKRTGSDQIVFVLNGRIVRDKEYDSIVLKEGDDIRYIHPFFGG